MADKSTNAPVAAPVCSCGQRDAERYPDTTDRVIVPTDAACPVHGVSAAIAPYRATIEIDLWVWQRDRAWSVLDQIVTAMEKHATDLRQCWIETTTRVLFEELKS